ncbi:MAG: Na+/H+ antiporter subunit E [Pseudomonadota bacterium]
MGRAVSLAVVMALLWLALSGHFEPWLLGLGGASAVLVAWIAHRLEAVDHEGHPLHLAPRGLGYWPWLMVEIVKANLDVARAILSSPASVDPSVFRVKAGQRDELGLVIHANSITLTPGTVTMDVEPDGWLTVHALTPATRAGVESGEMDRRVSRFVGDT